MIRKILNGVLCCSSCQKPINNKIPAGGIDFEGKPFILGFYCLECGKDIKDFFNQPSITTHKLFNDRKVINYKHSFKTSYNSYKYYAYKHY